MDHLLLSRHQRRTLDRMKIVGVIALLLASLTAGSHVTAAPAYHCGQYHDVIVANGGFTEAQWARLDAIMWRVSRCDPSKHVGRAYGLLQIVVPADTSIRLGSKIGTFHQACLPSGNPADLLSPWATAMCAHNLVRAFGYHPWGE